MHRFKFFVSFSVAAFYFLKLVKHSSRLLFSKHSWVLHIRRWLFSTILCGHSLNLSLHVSLKSNLIVIRACHTRIVVLREQRTFILLWEYLTLLLDWGPDFWRKLAEELKRSLILSFTHQWCIVAVMILRVSRIIEYLITSQWRVYNELVGLKSRWI